MPDLLQELEMPAELDAGRSRARLVWRGLRRKMLKKLQTALRNMGRVDDREAARGTVLGYNPTLLRGSNNSLEDRALKRITQAVGEALAARA